jgi:predicted NBD/HSP70 family sugar kinase
MKKVMHRQQLLKVQNRVSILNAVRQHGPISRADVARLTDLSTGAVTGLTRELIQNGLIYEKQEGDSRGGRPPILLALHPDGAYVVGIKLTEDHITFALTSLDADVIERSTLALQQTDPRSVARKVREGIFALLESSHIQRGKLLGVGIGMAGIIDGDAGTCQSSPILGWKDVPFAELVAQDTNLPVYLDNDVNTLTLMEKLYGSGAGIDHFLTITVGRGIGLGIVVNGQLYRGMGGAGEFGHIVFDPNGPPCACGRRGCLETFVGDPWLLRRARLHSLAVADNEELLRAAQAGSVTALQVLCDAGEMLGRGVAMLVNILHPQLLIFSGEGIRYGDFLLDSMRKALYDNAMPGLSDRLRLHVEPLGDDAWARGAASLVLQELFRTPHPDLQRVGSLL